MPRGRELTAWRSYTTANSHHWNQVREDIQITVGIEEEAVHYVWGMWENCKGEEEFELDL